MTQPRRQHDHSMMAATTRKRRQEHVSRLRFLVVLYKVWHVRLPLVAVGTLLTVFGFLACRPTAVRTCDVLLFLGLGAHLAVVLTPVARSAPSP